MGGQRWYGMIRWMRRDRWWPGTWRLWSWFHGRLFFLGAVSFLKHRVNLRKNIDVH